MTANQIADIIAQIASKQFDPKRIAEVIASHAITKQNHAAAMREINDCIARMKGFAK